MHTKDGQAYFAKAVSYTCKMFVKSIAAIKQTKIFDQSYKTFANQTLRPGANVIKLFLSVNYGFSY
jgi:hypothetical protein